MSSASPFLRAGNFWASCQWGLQRASRPRALRAAICLASASASSRDYVQNRYHQPTDEWDSTWTMDAAAADVALIYAVGRELADGDQWPEWNAGAEFGPARDTSKASRR